jgi:hypothetical protein
VGRYHERHPEELKKPHVILFTRTTAAQQGNVIMQGLTRNASTLFGAPRFAPRSMQNCGPDMIGRSDALPSQSDPQSPRPGMITNHRMRSAYCHNH